jgi:phosphoglycolate phosphatase-like HAD superfamily hydrolase
MKKVTILCDIDLTLIDTAKLRALTSSALIKFLKVDKKDYEAVSEKYARGLKSSTDFNPQHCLKCLSSEFGKNVNSLKKIFYNPKYYRRSLFTETASVLGKLFKKEIKLGIFSEGFKKFQRKKLKNSGILKFFDRKNIFIFRRKTKKSSVIALPKNSIIIDDNLAVLEEIEELSNSKKLKLV